MAPTGLWTGRYYVWPPSAFDGLDLSATASGKDKRAMALQSPHETMRVSMHGMDYMFLCKAKYDWVNCTIEGQDYLASRPCPQPPPIDSGMFRDPPVDGSPVADGQHDREQDAGDGHDTAPVVGPGPSASDPEPPVEVMPAAPPTMPDGAADEDTPSAEDIPQPLADPASDEESDAVGPRHRWLAKGQDGTTSVRRSCQLSAQEIWTTLRLTEVLGWDP